jgi:2-polyprenyl-3-methyl-5-hydroxy-6-metoxy-1,4-benzoquinol methylase
MSEVRYATADVVHREFLPTVRAIASRPGVVRMCDIGAGAKPTLDVDEIAEFGLDCTLLDISADELAKAPDGYQTLVADVTAPNLEVGQFDLVVSKMLAEHVADAECFHRNVFRMLAPGGTAVHFFPTLYYPWFVVNLLVPEALAQRALRLLHPNRTQAGRYAKFPAYYRWCKGPTQQQLQRFTSIGFNIDEYWGGFGTNYLSRVPPLEKAEMSLAQALVRRPVPQLTSFGMVVLSKPA